MCVHPRVIHLLRSSFSDVITNLASSFDVVVRECFEQLVGFHVAVGSSAERQLQLPIRLGGCGLTPMLRIAPAAFLGSWMLCLQRVEQRVGPNVLGPSAALTSAAIYVAHAEQSLQRDRQVHPIDWQSIASQPTERGQRALMAVRNRTARAALLAAATVQGRTRIQCCAGRSAGAFLTVVPTDDKLSLSNLDMQLAVRMRLGLPLTGV